MIRKYEYAIKYVFGEQGVTLHPPYKKLRPRNFDKGKMNTKDRNEDYANQDMNNYELISQIN